MKKILILTLLAISSLLGFSQDPYQTIQKISNPFTHAQANGAVSSAGPMWSLMTDTVHAYAIPKYRGAGIMRHADSLWYTNTGSYWRCVEQPFPVEYPMYVDYTDPAYPRGILKVALPDGGNKLLRTGGITLDDHDVTVAPDIIWTFNSQVKVRDVPYTITLDDATTGYRRIDILFIDSLDNFQHAIGDEDTAFIRPPQIPYNAIPITSVNIFGDSAISIDPTDLSALWSTNGNIANSSSKLGTTNDIPVRLISNNLDILTISKNSLFIGSKDPTNGDSYPIVMEGRGAGVAQRASIFVDGYPSGLYELAFSNSVGGYAFYGNGSNTYIRLSNTGNIGAANLNLYSTSISSGTKIGNGYTQTSGNLLSIYNSSSYNNQEKNKFQIRYNGQTQLTTDSTGSGTWDANAALDIKSTTGGLLIPRMNSTQRDAMSSPTTSMLIYNTTTAVFEKYNGTSWVSIEGGSSGWGLTGSSISSGNFLGTTNNEDLVFKRNNAQVGKLGITNVAIGTSALINNQSGGTGNIAIGNATMQENTTGDNNTAVGIGALLQNTTGFNNIAIGYNAGQTTADPGLNTTGSSSIFIGYDTKTLSNNETNQIVIGSQAIGNGSNTVTIGNSSITKTFLKGDLLIGLDAAQKVGINTMSPGAALHIKAYGGELSPVIIDDLGTFADDTAAGVGGLTAGMLYKTSAGVLMVKL